MKVTVTRLLNKRIGMPSVNASKGIPLEVGEALEVVDQVHGDSLDGNCIWYKDEGNNYYWSGGLNISFGQLSLDWWHEMYALPDVWKRLTVKGFRSRIAIIDTGIDFTHPYIDPSMITGINSMNGSKDITDNDGHGTAVAGTIMANGINFVGFAPFTELYIVKASETGTMTGDELIAGIKAVPDTIDIVCISHALQPETKLGKALQDLFIQNKDKVFICCAGDNGITNVNNNLPASISQFCTNVLSVAAVNKERKASEIFSCRSDCITLSAPGEEVKYLNKWNTSKIFTASGTSFSAPMVSGLIGLAKSYLQAHNKFSHIQIIADALRETLAESAIKDKSLYGNGIINPLKFSEKIKSI